MVKGALTIALSIALATIAAGNMAKAGQSVGVTVTSGQAGLAEASAAFGAAQQGLEVAEKLKALFGGNKDDETAKRLKEIQAQNNKIMKMMARALDILENLGVTINTSLAERSSAELNTELRAQIKLANENWSTELRNPSLLTRYRSKQAYRQILVEVRGITRRFVEDQIYGFAYFQNIGEGMLYESWLSRRTDESDTRREQLAKEYIGYFERVLNPAIAGSVAAQLKAAQAQADRTAKILDEADATVATGKAVQRTHYEISGICSTPVTTYEKVIGNRSNAYKIEITQNRGKRECTGGEGPGGGFGGVHALLSDKTLQGSNTKPLLTPIIPDPIDNQDSSLRGRAKYWNDVRAVNATAAEQARVLQTYSQVARVYLEAAQTIGSAK